ncbi:HIT family protein [Saccharothrix lopnurensis]|uniref:HIT family protein n=1 Tax=Saccharothrix lopnurensis TaxID=1670621 RepID=A0ABW1PHL2_9PSEU
MTQQGTTWRRDRIGSALRGDNPTVLARLEAGFAVVGDAQFLPGYCVLLADDPRVGRLTDLPRPRRLRFLADVDLLAEAVEVVCGRRDPGFRRVDVEILGNAVPHLHAHVRARYGWEPAERVDDPVHLYPPEVWTDPATALGPRHDELRGDLTAELDRLQKL